MRTSQLISRAILFLPVVSVLVVQCIGASSPGLYAAKADSRTFAENIHSGFLSGISTLEKLSLEDDYAVLASSPERETAEEPSEQNVSTDNIAIRAISPGYTTSAGKNAGELIELVNLSYPDTLLLDNLQILYTSKPTDANPYGKSTPIYTFPPGSKFIGRSIILRYSGSPEIGNTSPITYDLTYDTSLAMAGSLSLVISGSDGEGTPPNVLSEVCWTGGEDCLPAFSTTVKSRSYTTIVRNDETGEYSHVNDYQTFFDSNEPGLYLPPTADDGDNDASDPSYSDDSAKNSTNHSAKKLPDSYNASTTTLNDQSKLSDISLCRGLEFSEILTYYSEDSSEQFIEFYNSSGQTIPISNCRVRYKKKLYFLSTEDNAISPHSYFVYHPEITLTKNPTTENIYELVDANNEVIDKLTVSHGQKKATSFALIDQYSDSTENWLITYSPTPGAANIYQEFQTCPAGKVINLETGNCVNATSLKTTLKDCGEGKYRNPETGRCKSYNSSEASSTECKEGYELNLETNRCRKIKENNGADYPIVPITDIEEHSTFIALWAIGAIFVLGVVYVIFQFRHEIVYCCRKLLTKFKK